MRRRCEADAAEDHWADSCPVKARLKAEAKAALEESPSTSPKTPKAPADSPTTGKGKGKAKEGKGKKGKQGAKPKVCVTDPQPASSGAAPDPVEAGASSAGDGTAAINAEILSVLRSMKTKTLRLSAASGPTGHGFLDSGASASLRQGSPQELEGVALAVGEAAMHVNSAGTLLVRESVQPIVPMHALPLLGCEISWNDRGIHVRHPAMGVLPVRLRDGTPELPEFLVIRLIAEYERFLMRHQAARSTSERMWQQAVGQSDTTLTTI